ncbi:Lipase class 2 OS=Tsukamurella paurometabola (strain ATCC 8368 / DSM / CCUG 35730 / CIP 100753/ JCM 10117 / KCTC 9821 / NBRC 16120 / NCIMB 702349 / NCTC 13040) OX=521096 GN=Tpau_3012 PE=4 SV=1 [Tsukamurella paurometabola]|uniref:Lipase class 2 n=1 Tax=Tsukamurella paurometabola (strain ATCC 8368 / DSM 20162 / CCUG 35730 / CIP 100753 / JCM 10117 / KCTC 9821 / NBRC 16120 / NCIMB 702349 / NCTC 13040) TaxID=521096 RepID=D5UUA4_TSUPD|nr:alpha/beta fold hydrolase [Tsukamurella paurometabola]ADG79607.1 lipase class 2 [Tsukamurella paurometabola DSM 20162]SUP36418.1 Extracellular esterase estB precursor [Tsukamurella paurometabola]
MSPRTLVRRAVGAVFALVLVIIAVPAQAAPPLPENFNFFGGIPSELTNPNGSLPGTNDYACKPTARHPNPVVLVHGTGGGSQTNWGAYAPLLKNNGYCVFSFTYGALPGAPWPVNQIGGTRPLADSAEQLKAVVERVLGSTGARKVDLIGHSQGTLMPSYYVKYLGGADKVGRYVSLAPLWRGTGADIGRAVSMFARGLNLPDPYFPVFESIGDMLPGSRFLEKIWAGGSPYATGVEYTNISTRYDELVLPYTSGQLAGRAVTNIVVQDTCAQDFSDHLAIAGSRRAAYFVLNALDPAHPRTVPCYVVPPLFGA